VTGLQLCLSAEIVGVIVECAAVAVGELIVSGSFGEVVVEHVGVAEREIRGGGAFAGMSVGVAGNAGVSRGGACGCKLLRHGTKLR